MHLCHAVSAVPQPLIVALSLLLGSMLPGCDSTAPRDQEARYLLRACRWEGNPDGELFRVILRDTAQIAAADLELRDRWGRFVSGRLAPGDGGFNAPWNWHLIPDSTWVAEFAIELCDGCPSAVEDYLDGWLELGMFCPWSAQFVRREY
jgi:hypothetical protein